MIDPESTTLLIAACTGCLAIGVGVGRRSKRRECDEMLLLSECRHHTELLETVIQAKRDGAAAERAAAGVRALVIVEQPQARFRAEEN